MQERTAGTSTARTEFLAITAAIYTKVSRAGALFGHAASLSWTTAHPLANPTHTLITRRTRGTVGKRMQRSTFQRRAVLLLLELGLGTVGKRPSWGVWLFRVGSGGLAGVARIGSNTLWTGTVSMPGLRTSTAAFTRRAGGIFWIVGFDPRI